MQKKDSIVIRREDIPSVRKRQPPPGKTFDGEAGYSRKRKHPKRDERQDDEAPGRYEPAGRFPFEMPRGAGRFRPRGAVR